MTRNEALQEIDRVADNLADVEQIAQRLRFRLRTALKELSPWLKPEAITELPEFHSDTMHYRQLLIVLDEREYPCVGWYLGGRIQEWRMDGSPSTMHPTHWMPMPNKPNEKAKSKRRRVH